MIASTLAGPRAGAYSKTARAPAAGLEVALLLHASGAVGTAMAADIELRGAGSTFIAPMMEAWAGGLNRKHPNVVLRYDAVGSGEGVERFQAGTVDFGASDTYLSSGDGATFARDAVQAPTTAGMIVLAYNLPGVRGELRLPRDVYADIFLGKIQNWDDPRIRAANPTLKLPSESIAVVSRQESSGTTYAFTDHLASVSKAWADGPGVGRTVVWPRATMRARGNEGVASRIKISEGAIGYLEYGFALRLNLPMAALENRDGAFVEPTPQSGGAALASTTDVPLAELDKSTADPRGENSYPLVTYSWVVLHRDNSAEKTSGIEDFVGFALGEGQSYAPYFGYLPLPPKVAGMSKAAIDSLSASATDADSKAGLDRSFADGDAASAAAFSDGAKGVAAPEPWAWGLIVLAFAGFTAWERFHVRIARDKGPRAS